MDTLSKDDTTYICTWYALPMDSVTAHVEDVYQIVSFSETSKLQQWFQLDTYNPDIFYAPPPIEYHFQTVFDVQMEIYHGNESCCTSFTWPYDTRTWKLYLAMAMVASIMVQNLDSVYEIQTTNILPRNEHPDIGVVEDVV